MSSNKKTALILGASGLIGQELLADLLASDTYEKVVALVRTSMNMTHPKLQELVIDFNSIDLKGIKPHHVFCTIGSTIKKAGSKDAFRRIDKEIPLEIAQLCHKNGAELFAIVTSMGADENSFFFYNKVKGEVENGLLNIGFKYLGIFRPSMLLGKRQEKRMGEKIGQFLMNRLDFLTPNLYKAIHVKKVANAMLQYAEIPLEGHSIVLSDKMFT
jgi:uncharacterized protein YbjT (DUF2867 family)